MNENSRVRQGTVYKEKVMTTFEFFRKQCLDAVVKGCGTKTCVVIDPRVAKGSFEWVKIASQWFFGGAWSYQMKDVTDLQDMLARRLVKKCEYTSWQAKQLGQTLKYALTAKGLKELYKQYPDW